MQGLMMDVPLTITSIMEHAERVHGAQEIVSITRDNPRHRYTYADSFARARFPAAPIPAARRASQMCRKFAGRLRWKRTAVGGEKRNVGCGRWKKRTKTRMPRHPLFFLMNPRIP